MDVTNFIGLQRRVEHYNYKTFTLNWPRSRLSGLSCVKELICVCGFVPHGSLVSYTMRIKKTAFFCSFL